WLQRGIANLILRVPAVLSKHYLEILPPVFGYGNKFPFDLRREITQHRLIGRMNTKRRSNQQQARVAGRNFGAGEVSRALEGRKRARSAGGRLAVGVQGANANPVVECLQ